MNRPDPRPRRIGRYLPPLGDEFISIEVLSGLALAAAAVAALVWANVAPATYADAWTVDLGPLTSREWINEALMAVFFFVVGLEIKRELVEGQLREWRAAAAPVLGALGGMLVPALVYLAINVGGEGADGWGIPMATDIAFALGVLALLGSRVPLGAKVFLLALAIVDDVGSIIVIAFFYSDSVATEWLLASVGVVIVLVALRRFGVGHPGFYVIPGVAFWLCFHEAGVSAAIAGAVLALFVPAIPGPRAGAAERLEHRLHPWTGFVVVPLFALANAGIALDADALSDAAGSSVTLGIIAARLVGKVVGIGLFTLLALRLGIGRLPSGLRPRFIVAIGALAGIGFTVSLFIAEESLVGRALVDAKIGILVSAVLAGAIGALLVTKLGREGPHTLASDEQAS